ncbi:MAG: aromatic ring-hydroxylating dioxygenase subunit alpha [Solirubrobacteraceae bacterium]|jgi:phenylpropionate dioxygenase-like ring-hydroxylating dioxygenase large terminal subunit
MDQATQELLIERTFELQDQGAEGISGEETEWPVELYLDEDRFRRETRALARLPIPLAHVSQIREPGDFITETVLGRPVLVTRSADGRARAFLNVCRHRGSELVTERCGRGAKSFVCPYHAWTYETDGRLSHVPDERRSFPNLDRSQRGLVELPASERHGFVWVTLDPTGETDLDAFLGPLDEDLEGYALERHEVYRTDSWTNAFNWKTGVESFLENYHFAVLHRETAARVFIHNLAVYDQLNVHFRAFAPKKSLQDLRSTERESWTINGTATIMYVIFPFSCLFVEKDHYNLVQLFPESFDRCRVRTTHIVRRLSPRLEEYWDANIDFFLSAVREDLEVCESIQRGYASGANATVLFGRNEVACDSYRRTIEQLLAPAE